MARHLVGGVGAAGHQPSRDAEVARLELMHGARFWRRRGQRARAVCRRRRRLEGVAVGDDHEAQVVLAAQRKQVVRLRAAPVGVPPELQHVPLCVVVFQQLDLLVVLGERVVAAHVAAVAAGLQQRRPTLHALPWRCNAVSARTVTKAALIILQHMRRALTQCMSLRPSARAEEVKGVYSQRTCCGRIATHSASCCQPCSYKMSGASGAISTQPQRGQPLRCAGARREVVSARLSRRHALAFFFEPARRDQRRRRQRRVRAVPLRDLPHLLARARGRRVSGHATTARKRQTQHSTCLAAHALGLRRRRLLGLARRGRGAAAAAEAHDVCGVHFGAQTADDNPTPLRQAFAR